MVAYTFNPRNWEAHSFIQEAERGSGKMWHEQDLRVFQTEERGQVGSNW